MEAAETNTGTSHRQEADLKDAPVAAHRLRGPECPDLGRSPQRANQKPDQVSLAGQRTHRELGVGFAPLRKRPFELGGRSQLRLDRVEVGGKLGTHALDRRNDRNRDAGGNQSVFDGGSARLVSKKLLESDFQLCLLLTLGRSNMPISSCCNLRFNESQICNFR